MATATKRTGIDVSYFRRRELIEYEASISDMSEPEREELRDWVIDGHSPYDNPYSLYDENGYLMDYISGCRIGDDMCKNPEKYSQGVGLDPVDADDDMPF